MLMDKFCSDLLADIFKTRNNMYCHTTKSNPRWFNLAPLFPLFQIRHMCINLTKCYNVSRLLILNRDTVVLIHVDNQKQYGKRIEALGRRENSLKVSRYSITSKWYGLTCNWKICLYSVSRHDYCYTNMTSDNT